MRLTDGEACAPGAAALDTDAKLAAARARVYEELRRTLKPRLQAELGGALARVKPRNSRDSFPPVWKSNLRRVLASSTPSTRRRTRVSTMGK